MRDETAQLRAGLDEREIFWIDIPLGDGKRTCWKSTDDQDGYCYFDEDVFGVTVLMVTGISAEEVIDAVQGPICHFELIEPESMQRAMRGDRMKCDRCGYVCARGFIADERFKYCPNCGAKVVAGDGE